MAERPAYLNAGARYTPAPDRYARMEYRRCGRSGLKLPAVQLFHSANVQPTNGVVFQIG